MLRMDPRRENRDMAAVFIMLKSRDVSRTWKSTCNTWDLFKIQIKLLEQLYLKRNDLFSQYKQMFNLKKLPI